MRHVDERTRDGLMVSPSPAASLRIVARNAALQAMYQEGFSAALTEVESIVQSSVTLEEMWVRIGSLLDARAKEGS